MKLSFLIPSLSAHFYVGAMLLQSTFSSKKLEKPHFPRNPGFTYIVLTMRLQGHACPQFAPKNFGAEGVWTTALPLKKNPCDLVRAFGPAAENVSDS